MSVNMCMYVPVASDAYKNSNQCLAIVTQKQKEEILNGVSNAINNEIKSGHFTAKLIFNENLYPNLNLFDLLHEVAEGLEKIGYQVSIGKNVCIYTLAINWEENSQEEDEDMPF